MSAAQSNNRYRIALIPGDVIGQEVVPEGVRALEAAGRRFGFSFDWQQHDWSCALYKQTGHMMPEDGVEEVRGSDAILLGAIGLSGATARSSSSPTSNSCSRILSVSQPLVAPSL